MMSIYLVLIAFIGGVNCQNILISKDPQINSDGDVKSHYFNYNIQLGKKEPHNFRSEIRYKGGKVLGSYSLTNSMGHYRTVEYTADENGFRAIILTNEPGTGNRNPANVIINPEYEPVQEAPTPYEMSGPQPPIAPIAHGFPRAGTFLPKEDFRAKPVR